MLTILFECLVIRIAESKHSTVICAWTRFLFAVNFVVCFKIPLGLVKLLLGICTPFWTCAGLLELLNPGETPM